MKNATTLALLLLSLGAPLAGVHAQQPTPALPESELVAGAAAPVLTDEERARQHVLARVDRDFAALKQFRPGYAFWQHIFVIPDGSIAFGSREDGRLLATFPSAADWTERARWEDQSLAQLLEGQELARDLSERRDEVAALFEPSAGPVQHNPTRGNFLLPNARVYGSFIDEWATIYERFGVPAEVGLAQAILESGLNGKTRSSAGAIGLCQWMPRNWTRMNRLSEREIEVQNQTTQAPYCAAYLLVLSTKYNTFIPALSEHHSGGANVGRTIVNGERLGGADIREQYLLGSQLARDLRTISPRTYSDIYRTYGPRSYLYAEMVFGNAETVRELKSTIPQQQIFAMHTPRDLPLSEIVRLTGLSEEEVERFNPALIKEVPADATVYLPMYVPEFGDDVSFWHRPAGTEYTAVLNDFVRLETTPEQWNDPAFDQVIRGFERRFRATDSEEGTVMATVLAYVMQERSLNHKVIAEFRENPRVLELFQQGVQQRATTLGSAPTPP